MAEAFGDTSGLAEYFVPTQPFHRAANALVRQWWRSKTRVVTTSYVIAELVALLTSPLRLPRSRLTAVIDLIKTAGWIEIVHVDEALDAEAWNLLKVRRDKEWSLADCAGFVLMQRRGITEALATDHHFEQAGFVRLLK
jgi:predicted nucleic acid-binding protein